MTGEWCSYGPTIGGKMETDEVKGVLAELAKLGDYDVSRAYPIGVARKAIADSGGAYTWLDAGETWARLMRARPGSNYPPL